MIMQEATKRLWKFIKLYKKGIIIGFIFFVFAGIALCTYSLYYPFTSQRLHWRDISVSDFRLKEDGPIYSVTEGQISVGGVARELIADTSPQVTMENSAAIRFALFSQINKEDPLFGGPGFDANVYEKAVNELSANQNEFKSDIGLSEDIYPLSFMNKITEVNKLNDAFEKDKSVVNANKLLAVEKAAASAYRSYAVFLRSKLNQTKLPSELFVQSGGSTSRAILLSDLQQIIDNAASLSGEISSRSYCLNYSAIFCNRKPLKVFDDYSDVPVADQSEVFPGLTVFSSQPAVANGPYQVVTPCFRKNASETDARLLYLLESHEAKDISSQIADNVYFEKLSAEQFGIELYNQYLEHGVEWDVATLSNGYACNDMEYQASLATVNSYYKQYGQKPLFDAISGGNLPSDLQKKIATAREAEQLFANEKYPSEMTMSKIAVSYANLYNQIIEDEQNKSSMNISSATNVLKDNLLFRFNYINDKLADYGRSISYLSFRTQSHASMSEVNPKGQTELNYVYLMRNDYALTLAGFSPSVWRNNSRLQYLSADTMVNPKLVGFDDFVKQFGVEYANRVMAVTRRDVIVDELKAKAATKPN